MKVVEEPRQAEVDHPDAEALIREARQRQRRRWVLVMIVMVLVASATAWALSSNNGAGRADTSKAPTQTTNLTQFLTRARQGETEALTATYRYLSGPNRGEGVHLRATSARGRWLNGTFQGWRVQVQPENPGYVVPVRPARRPRLRVPQGG